MNVFVLKHIHALQHIGQCHLLRSGHDDGALHRDVAHESDVDIARSRRHIYEEEVQLAPLDLKDHLLKGIASHRATPDKCLAFTCEIPDGHPFYPILFSREHESLPILFYRFRLEPFGAGHRRHAWPVDIGIGQSHLVAQSSKRYGQIHRNGALSDATLSGCHTDNMLDVSYLGVI